MKKYLTNFYLHRNVAFAILISFVALTSCKKNEAIEPIVTDTINGVEAVSNESLIKFLSISLSVPKEEIIFDADNQEFVLWGKLRLKRSETEEHYKNANVYQAIYGK